MPPLNKLVYPGAANLIGAISLSTEEIDSRLTCAYARQRDAYPFLQLGFQEMSVATRETQLLELDGIVDGLVKGVGDHIPYQPSVEASISAVINMGRCYGAKAFLERGGADGSGDGANDGGGGGDDGGEEEELLRPCEQAILPAVLMYMSIKLDEVFPPGCLLPQILAAFNVRGADLCREISREIEKLEFRICKALKFAVLPETPLSFLHLYIARAVSEKALLEGQTASIGELAAKTCLGWVKAGFLASTTPSEMAVEAFELAVTRERGVEAADNVCRAAGCVKRVSNNEMSPCHVLGKSSGDLSGAPGTTQARDTESLGAGGRSGRGDDGSGEKERGGGDGGGDGNGGGGDGGGGGGEGWTRKIPEDMVREVPLLLLLLLMLLLLLLLLWVLLLLSVLLLVVVVVVCCCCCCLLLLLLLLLLNYGRKQGITVSRYGNLTLIPLLHNCIFLCHPIAL